MTWGEFKHLVNLAGVREDDVLDSVERATAADRQPDDYIEVSITGAQYKTEDAGQWESCRNVDITLRHG